MELKNFFNKDTIVAFLLSFTMWIVYCISDFKLTGNSEGYLNNIVIFISILISIAGAFYFTYKFTYIKMDQKKKIFLVFLTTIISSAIVYFNIPESKGFLKEDYALITIFTGMQIFLFLIFGWSIKDTDVELSKSPEGAINNEFSEEDLEQTKMSLKIENNTTK